MCSHKITRNYFYPVEGETEVMLFGVDTRASGLFPFHGLFFFNVEIRAFLLLFLLHRLLINFL